MAEPEDEKRDEPVAKDPASQPKAKIEAPEPADAETAPNAEVAKAEEPKAASKPSVPAAKAVSEPKVKTPSEPPAPPPPAPPPASAPAVKAASESKVKQAEAEPHRASAKEPAAPPAFPSSRKLAAAKVVKSGTPLEAYEALARSARLADLVAIAERVLVDAAMQRRADWGYLSKVEAAAEEAKLARADADTPFGNVLSVLGTGPEGEVERALAAAIAAHAVAEGPRDDDESVSGDILWLAANTAFDATSLLDRALGDEAADLWRAIGERVRRIDEGRGGALRRGEAFVGAAALAASSSDAAKKVALDLAEHLKDPGLARVVGASSAASGELTLEGEMVAAPRGFVLTTILAMTGILFVVHALRLVAKLALAYRRPAEVSLTEAGIRVNTRTEMLGKILREREHVIVRAGLVRVVREVRYPRAAFYAGLLALAIGSYIGVRAFTDGVRAASPSLLLTGLVIVALGIAADFVLGSVLPGARGRCRVAFVPRTGKTLCVADVDMKAADAAIKRTLR